jgi:hypothetical protein
VTLRTAVSTILLAYKTMGLTTPGMTPRVRRVMSMRTYPLWL